MTTSVTHLKLYMYKGGKYSQSLMYSGDSEGFNLTDLTPGVMDVMLQLTEPMVTRTMSSAEAPRFEPITVTSVPPSTGPAVGWNWGGGRESNRKREREGGTCHVMSMAIFSSGH